MIIKYEYPPELPERLRQPSDLWVGTYDCFNPQLEVKEGPSSDEILRAFVTKQVVSLDFVSRTADMDDDEYDDEGTVIIQVLDAFRYDQEEDEEVYEGDSPWINFLAEVISATRHSAVGEGNRLWFWQYDGGGRADFAVNK